MACCAKCGMMNPDSAVFCTRCGAQLRSTQDTTRSAQPATGISTVNNYYYGRLRRRDRRRFGCGSPSATPAAFAEKEVIHEIVLVPCAYCGSLFPQTSIACPNCGAKRKT